jgi:hypothetical protein
MRGLARSVSAILLLSSGYGALAAGPVFNVNSVADVPDAAINGICDTGGVCNGAPCCTLRAAIMEADHIGLLPGEEVTINLPAGTYLLTRAVGVPDDESNGDLNLTNKIRIAGVGFDLSIIDANHLDRVIAVGEGAVVTLSDLRVQGGRRAAAPSRFLQGAGGGIAGAGSLTLLRCLVRDNQTTSPYPGGGIAWHGPALNLIDSIVRVNGATGGNGGGIYVYSTATAITRSVVHANGANYGGGIYQEGGSLKIVNSTIGGQNAAASLGGGLFLDHAVETALNNVTVATNTAPTGAATYVYVSSPVLSNSIFSGDLGCSGGGVTSNGFNLIENPGDCPVTGAYSQGAALLGPLGSYGGLTVTHPLTSDSSAVNAGDSSQSGCLDPLGAPLATDQRGVMRKVGGRCDLGAFEQEPFGDANGDGFVNVSDVFYLINFLFAGGPIPLGRANADAIGGIDVLDVFYLINFLFAGGAAPPGY